MALFRTFKHSLLSAVAMLYLSGCPQKPDDVDDDTTAVVDDDSVSDDDSTTPADDDTSADDDTTLDQLPVFKQATSSYTTQEEINFSQQYTAANATSYSIQTTLPSSKYLFNSSTGVLQLQNTNDTEVGNHNFTITAANQYGNAVHQSTITIENVNESPVIITSTLPSGTSNVFYNTTIQATDEDTGDTANFSLTSGNVPGLSLSSSGVLSGTPTQFGDYSLTVKVEDAAGLNDTQQYTLQIDPAAIFTVNVRNAYGGAHSPTFLSGIEVLFDTPYDSVSGVTDSNGDVTFVLNSVSSANNLLTVQDESVQGLGPDNDCSALSSGQTLDDCVGDFYNVSDPDVVINNGSNAADVWLIQHSDSDMSQSLYFDNFLTYFKVVATGTNYNPYVNMERWDADGDPGRFPLNVYNPNYSYAGIDFDDQARVAITLWNTDTFNVQYLVETTNQAIADIEMNYTHSNSGYNSNSTQVGTYEWQYIPVGIAYINRDMQIAIGVIHDSAHELGHALGHIYENSGDANSVWGGADLPTAQDKKTIYLINFLPDPDTTKHHLD